MSFGDWDSGIQVGTNYGPITAEFHHPPSKLQESLFRVDRTDICMDLDDKLPVGHNPVFNLYMNQYDDECLPDTRTDVLL
jgi:hypothetical protein